MISMGGSTIAGLAQWSVLRRRGVIAGRWLAFWIFGVVVGVGVAVAAIMGLEAAVVGLGLIDPASLPTSPVAQAAAWGAMLLILGSVTGAVAGAISARPLSSSLAGSPALETA
jgi:hypothetical protein